MLQENKTVKGRSVFASGGFGVAEWRDAFVNLRSSLTGF
jgi:hypothetical protein